MSLNDVGTWLRSWPDARHDGVSRTAPTVARLHLRNFRG